MKKNLLNLFVLAVVILGVGMTVSAQKKKKVVKPSITGIYEKFTVGEGSGDLEGMRVWIVNAGNEYNAIVQVAEGGAEDPKPEFVPVKVTGLKVEFTKGLVTYKGTITTAGLKLTYDDPKYTETLKRISCSSMF